MELPQVPKAGGTDPYSLSPNMSYDTADPQYDHAYKDTSKVESSSFYEEIAGPQHQQAKELTPESGSSITYTAADEKRPVREETRNGGDSEGEKEMEQDEGTDTYIMLCTTYTATCMYTQHYISDSILSCIYVIHTYIILISK